MKDQDKDIDLYRDTSVRYLGYANEVGEAFGPIYKHIVKPSYIVSFGYVFADTYDKYNKVPIEQKNTNFQYYAGLDCLLWQTFASVLIPGKIINIVANSMYKITHVSSSKKYLPSIARKWIPTMVALSTIPLIVHPIDQFVDHIFDNTLRKYIFNK